MRLKELLFKTINIKNYEWKYTYTVLKLRVKQVIYSQGYNDTIKRRKPQYTQLGILKIFQKIQQRASSPGESAAGIT